MDYGADDPQGIDQQLYLQRLIQNNPNIARAIAAAQGQADGTGLTYPNTPDQQRYTSNMRQAFPMEYYAGRVGGNITGNPAGTGRTLADMLRMLGSK
jgi:hypothetical protein